jgi:rhodanese-related sulfurtransferase
MIVMVLFGTAALSAWAADAEPAPPTRPAKLRKDVDVQEFDKLRQEKKHVVLDVRTPREFQEGHLPEAVNVDIQSNDFEKKIRDLDPERVYLVYCAAGVRSARACDVMEKMEFHRLYNMLGGMKEWKKAGKDVAK